MKTKLAYIDAGFKRLFDIVAAVLGLILLSPLFIIISLMIKWQDGGPVFYRAKRIGRDEQPFRLFKFRSMQINADRQGPAVTSQGDARITPVGKWLRRIKLDEMPQLLNVLKGDMSLVGPRPEDPHYTALYTAEQRLVLQVRPGITSAASLEFRHEEEILSDPNWETIYLQEVMPAKLAIDLDYLKQRTFWSDLGLILRTIISMVRYTRYFPQRVIRLIDASTNIVLKFRNRHFLIIDIIIFLLTPAIALALRLDFIPWLPSNSSFGKHTFSLVIVTLTFLCVKLSIFYSMGLYRRYWRYASIDELAQIIAAAAFVLLGQTIIFFAVLQPARLITGFPRSVPFIDGLLTLLAIGGVRYAIRMAERTSQRVHYHPQQTRVLIIGAGEAGTMIVREMQSNPQLGLNPVAFVDDDPEKQGARIRGVKVRGNHHDIPNLTRQTRARKAIIAMPTAPGKTIRKITQICDKVGLQTQIIPGIYELIGGQVSVNQLRTVQIEDLLRREPVQTDVSAVAELLRGKRVLITGGGGSIGSELGRQVLRCEPGELVIVGHGENSIFEIHNELQLTMAKLGQACSTKLHTAIADIRFANRLEAIFNEHRPQIVFHAAAHKHVPLMEANPVEAITNNVLGTRNLLEIAQTTGVARFVMISTDKAVNPTSIMGASKRIAELLVHQMARATGQPYAAVRFGNVLGSRGSVVNTFKQQIAAGGPVTVTHPEMERYFMSIPEAVQLVLQAAVLGCGGEVFMLDMGQPVKIVDLAHDLIELSGLAVGRDIDIVFTGARPGEKLFEELFIPGETYQRTRHEKIFIANNGGNELPANLTVLVDELISAAHHNQPQTVQAIIQTLVPEFKPNNYAEQKTKQSPLTENQGDL